jgi:hypothetical protein
MKRKKLGEDRQDHFKELRAAKRRGGRRKGIEGFFLPISRGGGLTAAKSL